MVKVLLVGAGGFLGSIARYWVGGLVQDRTPGLFPFGTLAVNVLGCFLIGALSELADARSLLSAEARTFAMVGVLGGFTTFSAFGNETMNLLRERDGWLAAGNVLLHVVLAIGAVWVGRAVVQLIWR
ncbi:MAG: fluoride efflux transporter CrcB [Acidobacteria bacterium]|nr:fluoride efflux transporter CrcB [Acidobacteriota bacterium]